MECLTIQGPAKLSHTYRKAADHYPQLLQRRRNKENTLSDESKIPLFLGVEQLVGNGQRKADKHASGQRWMAQNVAERKDIAIMLRGLWRIGISKTIVRETLVSDCGAM